MARPWRPARSAFTQAARGDMTATYQGTSIDEIVGCLDPQIAPIVRVLLENGVETFESCQGGEGHAYPEPTVRFYGERAAGFRALAVAFEHGLRVLHLRRVWPIIDCEPTGPWWEMVFVSATTPPLSTVELA